MKIFKRIAAIIPMLADKEQSLWKKALVIGSAIYLISPIEFVPDFLLPIGLIDDIVLWACILVLLGDTLDAYANKPKKTKRTFVNYKKKFKGSTVIDDVEYEVTEDEGRGRENEKEQ